LFIRYQVQILIISVQLWRLCSYLLCCRDVCVAMVAVRARTISAAKVFACCCVAITCFWCSHGSFSKTPRRVLFVLIKNKRCTAAFTVCVDATHWTHQHSGVIDMQVLDVQQTPWYILFWLVVVERTFAKVSGGQWRCKTHSQRRTNMMYLKIKFMSNMYKF